MAKAIYKDGKVFRLRRGKLVEIPKQWVGKIPTEQTIRKRRSKQTKQQRAEQARPAKSGYFNDDYWKAKHGKARHPVADRYAEPVKRPDGGIENFMPRVGGKAFRCECGCNVFHKPDRKHPEIYQCNGCDARYEGA